MMKNYITTFHHKSKQFFARDDSKHPTEWLRRIDFGGIWYKKPEPKTRLMTRDEVLGFIVHTPHIVARSFEGAWVDAGWCYYENKIDTYEWATIDKDGNIGEPQKFTKVIE